METTPFGYALVTAEEVDALRKEHAPTPGGLLLLDVRTPAEYRSHRIPGARLLPIHELATRYQELDPDVRTICICEHGVRSEAAAEFLARQGFTFVVNLRGGMARWSGEIERG